MKPAIKLQICWMKNNTNLSTDTVKIPSKEDIIKASSRIKKYIHRTAVLKSDLINEAFGCELFFK